MHSKKILVERVFNLLQNNERKIRIGDVYLVNFEGRGSEQTGKRPGLVFSNNIGNNNSPNVIVLPLTTSLKKLGQPTHVLVRSDRTGLLKDSLVLCENPECVSKERLGMYLTTLPDDYMAKIAQGYLLATSAISFIDSEVLLSTWEKSIKFNRVA